jgi:soluble lytic murein transglycosylase-like protein
MRRIALLAACCAPLWIPAGASGQTASAATPASATTTPIIVDGRTRVDSRMPDQMTAAQRTAYRQIFGFIRGGNFTAASAALDRMPSSGLLTATGWAELWLAAGSPKPSAESLSAWLASNSGLPQAERIAVLARRAGVSEIPALPQVRGLVPVERPSREKPRPVKADVAAAAFAAQVQPLLAADQVTQAAYLLDQASLDSDSRTQWTQRIAWAWYNAGNDREAIALAEKATANGSGEWSAMAHWVAGLAAFRSGGYALAASHFAQVASRAHSGDFAAAGQFWTARALTASGRPDLVTARLRLAARYEDSFYGLLARRVLGIETPERMPKPDFLLADWKHVDQLPGARRAAALVEIGELGVADRELRYLAMTGPAQNHVALTYLAAKLNLPATQYWLSHNAPYGITPPVFSRYPAPDWVPSRGWRVDRSLVYAHALQESRFITDARSRVGARGIMQLMPGTARQIASTAALPTDEGSLADPAFNIEFGQTYLEELRDSQWTAGLLPKVIAAYNAGPGSVKKWNERMLGGNDPLLFIESIPFAETRHYVEVVLRNYWMYQQNDGAEIFSLDALAQGMWPRFPGMPGKPAVRGGTTRAVASAN